MINLTDEEKRRFAAWCEQEARTDEAMVEQMEKLSLPAAVMQRNKAEAMACRVVAKILTEGEKQEIRG